MIRKILWSIAGLIAVGAIVLFVLYQRADTEHLVLDDDARALAPGRFVRLSDGMTHYDISGPESGPVVILIHGFSVPYYIWDTTSAALADAGFRALRFDAFGRGFSDRPDLPYNGVLFERQVKDLIDSLGLEAPVDVVGLSMGGAVAVRFVAKHPERVRRLVLLAPSHRSYRPPPFPLAIGSVVMTIAMVPDMAEGQLTDFLHPENYPTWVEQYRVQMQYKGFRRAIISTVYEFLTEDHLSHYAAVQAHGTPVKLIWGIEDRTLDFAGAAEIQAIVDVDFMPVEEAGHLPHIERADIVNPAIVDFLQAERGPSRLVGFDTGQILRQPIGTE